MAYVNPIQFFRQVRQEVSKVTWPTRRETLLSTGLVAAMVVLASVFFMLVDQFFGWAVRMIFGLGV
jgi:preprotein translocase subunit SecE